MEEASALDQIDAIAATPGVDALFIGTSDLSFSLGLRGRQNEPALDSRDRAHCRGGAPPRKVSGQAGGNSRTGSALYGTGLPAVSDAHRNRADGTGSAAAPGPARHLRHSGQPSARYISIRDPSIRHPVSDPRAGGPRRRPDARHGGGAGQPDRSGTQGRCAAHRFRPRTHAHHLAFGGSESGTWQSGGHDSARPRPALDCRPKDIASAPSTTAGRPASRSWATTSAEFCSAWAACCARSKCAATRSPCPAR